MTTSTSTEPLQLAQTIFSFNETADDPFRLLSLAPGLPPVTLSTPIADLRTNYRKLAALIHPDRIKKVFEHATEAFQRLVRIFENVNDTAYRAKLTKAAAASSAKQGKTASASTTKSKKETVDKKKEAAPKKSKAVANKKRGKRDEDDEDTSSGSDEDDVSGSSSDEDVASRKQKRSSSSSLAIDDMGMKPRDARDNTGCYRTPVACPNCNDVWQPDDSRHYVLLMAYGVRVFCNTCLLQFGPAAALHFCPCCKAPANYDTTMFDTKVKCGNSSKCGKTYGFASVVVNNKHLADVREKLRAEAEKRARDDERARRAAARSGAPLSDNIIGSSGGAANEDAAVLEDHIGQCMVTGSCPICEKGVRLKAAREHVAACMANPPKKGRGDTGKKGGLATVAKEKKPTPKKKPTAKKSGGKSAAKRRNRDFYDSDSD